jgi:hypothetical protein
MSEKERLFKLTSSGMRRLSLSFSAAGLREVLAVAVAG